MSHRKNEAMEWYVGEGDETRQDVIIQSLRIKISFTGAPSKQHVLCMSYEPSSYTAIVGRNA